MDVTICCGTFGDQGWADLARSRAIPSAEAQGVPVVHCHGETLASARNEALSLVYSEWVVFLDADDELASGYIEALATGSADLRAPAVSYVKNGRPRPSYVPKVAGHTHDCTAECLRDGNWLVIGTAVRTEMLRAIGGFRDWPVYEDWDVFQRCWLAGATIETIPAAIYLAYWRPNSRNRAPEMALKNRIHHEIVAANLGEAQVAA